MGSSILVIDDNFINFKIYVSGIYGLHITSKIHCINYLKSNFTKCETLNNYRKEILMISKYNLERQGTIVVGNNENVYKCHQYNIFLDICIPYTLSLLLIIRNNIHHNTIIWRIREYIICLFDVFYEKYRVYNV